ncbi:hypothetical protein C8J40_10565 [Sphingomonas sp. PP-CC-3A-396]|nr:hypothetical protein C8J40_10565 [Sphingomonas sp. PP-CC-3A-396]
MTEHDEFAARVVPFAARWHVIHELDLAGLVAAHARLRDVCDRLEACADALPGRLSDAEAKAICRDLRAVVISQPRDETAVVDALFARDLGDPLTMAVMARVRARHASEAIQADDILAALSGFTTPCAEAFGYNLAELFRRGPAGDGLHPARHPDARRRTSDAWRTRHAGTRALRAQRGLGRLGASLQCIRVGDRDRAAPR